ncbi:MAG: hypothetical protein IJT90_01025 [Bacteroidaceae bacterium]|nr:hypothetical protein [Bacteroidaceae bacterium]
MTTQEYTAIDLVRNPELMNRNTIPLLQEAIKQYPFHQTLYLLLLQNMYKVHDPQFSKALKEYALMVGDRAVLFEMVEGMNYNIPVQKLEDDSIVADGDRTMILIDSFLKHLPDTENKGELQADYSAFLEQLPDIEEESSEVQHTPSPQAGLPLAKGESPEVQGVQEFQESESDEFTVSGIRRSLAEADDQPPAELADDDDKEEYFTEAMAAVYIKQHKFEQALEIIKAISADNPKKSVYFAEQIRYLELLVRLNSSKKL